MACNSVDFASTQKNLAKRLFPKQNNLSYRKTTENVPEELSTSRCVPNITKNAKHLKLANSISMAGQITTNAYHKPLSLTRGPLFVSPLNEYPMPGIAKKERTPDS